MKIRQKIKRIISAIVFIGILISCNSSDKTKNSIQESSIKETVINSSSNDVKKHLKAIDSDEALMVFDFDNETGLLSNCIPFAKVAGVWGWDNAFTNWGAAYDIEWAPNSEGLYVSSINGGGDLQWFDASAGSSTGNGSGSLLSAASAGTSSTGNGSGSFFGSAAGAAAASSATGSGTEPPLASRAFLSCSFSC